MSRDELLAELTRCIREYARTGDPKPLLRSKILAMAEALENIGVVPPAGSSKTTDLAAARVLAWLHWCRYGVLESQPGAGDKAADALLRAVTLGRPAYDVTPETVPAQMRALFEGRADLLPEVARDYAAVLLHQVMEEGDTTVPQGKGNLDLIIRLLRQALVGFDDEGERADLLSNLCTALISRFDYMHDVTDLDRATEAGRQAVEVGSKMNRPAYHASLGRALGARYEAIGDISDLEEWASLAKAALKTLPQNYPYRLGVLATAVNALTSLYEATGSVSDLDQAITIQRDLVRVTSRTATWYAVRLGNLGCVLLARFQHAGRTADAEEAVTALQSAIEELPASHPLRRRFSTNLCSGLAVRYFRTGNSGDLEAATAVGRKAIQFHAADALDFASTLFNLGLCLWMSYLRAGDLGHLNEAISLLTQAVEAIPETNPRHARYLSMLGSALRSRYGYTGELADLDEAVTRLRAAGNATPNRNPNRSVRLSNLANALGTQRRHNSDPALAQEALNAARAAVACTPQGHADLWRALVSLGDSLLSLYEKDKNMTLLDEAIEIHTRAVKVADKNDPQWSNAADSLGGALYDRHDATGRLADLNLAISALRSAVNATLAEDPSRTNRLFRLGLALHTHHEKTGAGEADAISCLRDAAGISTAAVADRIRAADWWGQLAAASGDWREAATAYGAAVQLIPLLAWRGLERATQEQLLGRWIGLASDAAACMINCGEPKQAIPQLELGRGVLLAQSLESRSDYAELRRQNPVLAERLNQIREALEARTEVGIPPEIPAAAYDRARRERRHALALEWSELVVSARADLPDFLAAPSIDELFKTASEGPVVAITLSIHRCDALIIEGAGQLQAVSLPDLNVTDVGPRIERFIAALTMPTRLSSRGIIDATLGWLWETITAPVLDTLGYTETPSGKWPHLWWCPAGPLSLLPLHAAGHQTGPSVLDRVVSSYTPTLRALAHARGRPVAEERPSTTVIALPHTNGFTDLPFAGVEAAAVAESLPYAKTFEDNEATRANVLGALQQSTFAHFACHARQDLEDPSSGQLILHDKPLSVEDISRLRLDGAELAFLSACETARGGVTVPDEAVHLSAVLQLAGYRHVIGTLWEVHDAISADVTRAFYHRLTAGSHCRPHVQDAALALHMAIRQVRDDYPDRPDLWAPYVHIGP
jgi:CHAT domain